MVITKTMKKFYSKPECMVITLDSPTVLVPASTPPGGIEGTNDITLDQLFDSGFNPLLP